MTAITRTIFGADLQSWQYLQKPYIPDAKTTINERFNIHTTLTPAATELHGLNYFCIGNKGHYADVAADGFLNVSNYKHDPENAGLFNFLPFVVRPVAEDLSVSERLLYGMRVPVTLEGGDQYWAYYLKRIDKSSLVPQKKKKTVINGVASYSPFVADEANLTPIPSIPANNELITVDGVSYEVVTSFDLSFSALDAQELRNACQIIYGDENRAVVSEIGMVAAIVKDAPILNFNLTNGTGQYKEAIRAGITDIATTYQSLVESSDGFDLKLNLGSSEPLRSTVLASGG